ncbi:MAG: ABC transporter substrate-binding protein, partial [Nitrososphaerales archaeon]
TNSVLDAQKDENISVAGVTAAGNYIWMNTLQGQEGSVKALGDKRVRQAINYAVDKEGIVRVFDNVHTPANGPALPWHIAFDPNHKNYPFDQAKAKSLLAEAGYADGEVKINYWTSANPETVTLGEVVRSNLTDVGMDINFRVLGRSESFRITRRRNQTQVHMDSLNIGLKFDQEYYDIFFTDRSNRSHAPYPILEELMDEARVTTDEEVHKRVYKQAADYVFEEALLVWPYWSSRFAVGKKGVLEPTMWPGENMWMPFLWKARKE